MKTTRNFRTLLTTLSLPLILNRRCFSGSMFLLAAIAALVGCESSNTDDAISPQGSQFIVTPGGSIEVGYFEQQTLSVQLLDSSGLPMPGAPVLASFIGPAHNGTLVPDTFNTDSSGSGKVVFTAPDKEIDFQIRLFSVDLDSEKFVRVIIDPERTRLSSTVSYEGTRQITDLTASLHEFVSCDDLDVDEGTEEVQIFTSHELPSSVEFSGLKSGVTYTLMVRGWSASGELRAKVCKDELVPNQPIEDLTIEDIPLNTIGSYDIVSTIQIDGEMDIATDKFARYLIDNFLAIPEKIILDEVRKEVIARQPFAKETFDQIRDQTELDAFLAQDFEDRGVDLVESFDPIWEMMKDHQVMLEAEGEIEFGSGDHAGYSLYHRVDRLVFSNGTGDSLGVFVVGIPETGTGVVEPGVSDQDLLYLDRHSISLGLGDPLHFLFWSALNHEFDSKVVAEVLQLLVDCEKVTVALLPWLEDVTDIATIQKGCETATVSGEQWPLLAVADMSSRYSKLVFEGSCRLEDPVSGDEVLELSNGQFQVNWNGVSLGGPEQLGPMTASFEAQRSIKE
jgi:hypothetical protein